MDLISATSQHKTTPINISTLASSLTALSPLEAEIPVFGWLKYIVATEM
jgi:hypothetical protein